MELIGTELNYTVLQIKKATPYLNTLNRRGGNGYTEDDPECATSIIPITDKERATAWYYVFNGHKKGQAYMLAHYQIYNEQTGVLQVDEIKKDEENPGKNSVSCKASRFFMRTIVRQAAEAISEKIIESIKIESKQTIIEQLYIQSTYDPKMFYNPSGQVKFTDWDQIPEKYRCCVESIETKYFGKDASTIHIQITLVDRNQARKQLMNICPNMLQPSKTEVLHKTLDEYGNEKGFNYSRHSDDELENELEAIRAQLRDAVNEEKNDGENN